MKDFSHPNPQSSNCSEAIALRRFEIPFLLMEVTRLMRVAYDARMGCIGLTGASAKIILILGVKESITQIELAKHLDVSRMSLGQAVDRLEKSGHIERHPDPKDRRVWRIRLTDEARARIPEILETAEKYQNVLLSTLTTDEVSALKGALLKLSNDLRTPPDSEEIQPKQSQQ